jgi:hypothetical protein
VYSLFSGNDLAPAARVDGEPVQEYLQRHYIDAVCHLAERLKDLPHVARYDTLNEPGKGFINWEDLCKSRCARDLAQGDDLPSRKIRGQAVSLGWQG